MVRSAQFAIILTFLNFSIVTEALESPFFIVATVNNSLFYLFCSLGLITGYEYRKKVSVFSIAVIAPQLQFSLICQFFFH